MGIIYKFANIHFYFEYTNRLSIFIFFSGPLSAIKFQKAEGRRGSKYRADEGGKEAFFAKSHHRQTDSEKGLPLRENLFSEACYLESSEERPPLPTKCRS